MKRRPCLAMIGFLALCLVGLAPAIWAQPPAADAPPAERAAPPESNPPQQAEQAPAADREPSGDDQVDEEYFELLKLFADTLDQVERNYVKKVSRRELMEAAIEGVLAKLDAYSDYIAPDQLDSFRRGVENEFGGIGIRVGVIDGQLTVITPLINTPAYRAGVLAGDRILKVGDANTEGMSLEDAIGRMKGRIGSEISLTVRHSEDNREQQVTLTREMVRMETVFGDRRLEDDRWDFMLDAERKIGYVRISTFSRHTTEDLQAAMRQLMADGLRGLILDLRFNPGGLLSTAVEVADMFLSEGTIVSTSGRNVPERTWSATKPGTLEGFPIVVLVNGYSASASEIVAAALQDHGRAVIVGQRTWGKGSVQNIIELEGGRSALKLTTAGYRRPSGKNIHRADGATPDDDWGVRPDEGQELILAPNETARLLAYHRDRDILLTSAQRQQNPPEPYIDRQLQRAIDDLTKQLDEPADPGKHL